MGESMGVCVAINNATATDSVRALRIKGTLKPGRTHAGPPRIYVRIDCSNQRAGKGHVQPFLTLNHLTVPVTLVSAMFLFFTRGKCTNGKT